eukprot:GEMP01034568.1.p1 GENE.GEMP01034568.1~~GEMP01034568.1.p1  ORF type:complete len:360 (+),score=74.08 GEMP01034568.1:338-1417(+)
MKKPPTVHVYPIQKLARNVATGNAKDGPPSADNRRMAAASLALPPDAWLADENVDFVPITFALPQDYALFQEEFRRNPNITWIMKPAGKAQGKGIFLVSKLGQLKKWSNQTKTPSPDGQTGAQKPFTPFREQYIISRYIDNPLLIGGKKFDLRLYVLVTSFRPMKAYLYQNGFCRFCHEQYTTDIAEFDNVFIHLTNIAIQKNADDYNTKHGGKWSIDDLRLYIQGTRGHEAADNLFQSMENIIITTLRSVQNVMINDKHCFEMYGIDILIDADLRPWLLEVNASPSLSSTTEVDRILKTELLQDTLAVVVSPQFGGPDSRMNGPNWSDKQVVGEYYCIIDETKRVEKIKKKPKTKEWR